MNKKLFKLHTNFSKTTFAFPVENYSLKKIEGGEKMMNKNKGFTLIELLIVIVIIGILAGVLIALIDPQTQQNRAKDATLQSTMNKIALAVGGFNSAYGHFPNGAEFVASIENETVQSGCTGTDTFCQFTLTTLTLPNACGASGYYGTVGDTGACQLRYQQTAAGDGFYIYGQTFGVDGHLYRYDSTTGSEIHLCTGTAATINCDAPIGG